MARPDGCAGSSATRRRGKVYDRREVARKFAWMRPNDLIFNYFVNNWLLGNDPPAFDMLAWNNDGTNLPAHFDARDARHLRRQQRGPARRRHGARHAGRPRPGRRATTASSPA